ncbi:MAG: hypothetical protein EBT95_00270 [Verrucomicrobia bacterium]|jgi:hypothetical protein|nr:hypothetical protein [Verrucomicrobiota bacterium]
MIFEAIIAKVLLNIDRSQRDYEVNMNRAQRSADFWNTVTYFVWDAITGRREVNRENKTK